jgi:hypothetical protein
LIAVQQLIDGQTSGAKPTSGASILDLMVYVLIWHQKYFTRGLGLKAIPAVPIIHQSFARKVGVLGDEIVGRRVFFV